MNYYYINNKNLRNIKKFFFELLLANYDPELLKSKAKIVLSFSYILDKYFPI